MADRFKVSILSKSRVNEGLPGEMMGDKRTGEIGVKTPAGNYISYSAEKRFTDHIKITEARSRKFGVSGTMSSITPDITTLPAVFNMDVNVVAETDTTPIVLTETPVEKFMLSVDVDSLGVEGIDVVQLTTPNKLSVDMNITGESDNYSVKATASKTVLSGSKDRSSSRMAIGNSNGISVIDTSSDTLSEVAAMTGFNTSDVSYSASGKLISAAIPGTNIPGFKIFDATTFMEIPSSNITLVILSQYSSNVIHSSKKDDMIFLGKGGSLVVMQVYLESNTVSQVMVQKVTTGDITSIQSIVDGVSEYIIIGTTVSPFLSVYKFKNGVLESLPVPSTPGFMVNCIDTVDSMKTFAVAGVHGMAFYQIDNNVITLKSKSMLQDTISDLSVNDDMSEIVLAGQTDVYFHTVEDGTPLANRTFVSPSIPNAKYICYTGKDILVGHTSIQRLWHVEITESVVIEDNIHDFNAKPIIISNLIDGLTKATKVELTSIKVSKSVDDGKTNKNIFHSILVVI